MFFKLFMCDIHNGIVVHWKKYLTSYFIFCFFSICFILERNVTEFINPDILTGPPTLGDFIMYIFIGAADIQAVGNIDVSGGNLTFTLPTAWIILFLWLLFLTLYYPYQDLMGYGKHMLILSKNRVQWWLSKSLWTILSVLVFFASATAAIISIAFLSGAKMTLDISKYMSVDFIGRLDTLIAPPWNISALLAPILVCGIAMCLMQQILSLFVKPTYSYLLMCIYLFCCSYYRNPFFIGNYSMAARSSIFVTDGFVGYQGVILGLWIVVLCTLLGALVFCKMDIINK